MSHLSALLIVLGFAVCFHAAWPWSALAVAGVALYLAWRRKRRL